jgi:Kef-type K+ transport system membrane component KefB
MTPSSIFLIQALAIVAVPVVLLRLSGLKGLMPLVVVQMMVGIALGPSVFGRIAPDLSRVFAGQTMLSSFSGLASVGVLIFGLISGLHLDPRVFSGKERAFWPMAIANVAVPTTFGGLAGIWILARYPDELLSGVTPFEFMAAIAICVSMNALPVLGAILEEMGLLGSRISNLALGLSSVNNIVLWMMLGVLLTATAASHSSEGRGLLSPVCLLALAPAYLVLMVRVVRPALSRMITARMLDDQINPRALVVVGGATIASALATELMGLHYITGAFLVGAIIPAKLHKPILDRLQVMTITLLMPFFFTLTGMRILIDLHSSALLEIVLVITAVAAVGIIGGTAAAARLNGEAWSDGFGLGSLLQSKGLTELIVVTILLDAGIVSPRVFTAVILMALISTGLTMPLARLALAREGRSMPEAPMAAPGQRN